MLHEIFYKSSEKTPQKIAISFGDESTSYEQLFNRHQHIASHLLESSFKSQERALLILPNGSEFMPCHLGVLAAGGISVPLDDFVSAENLAKISASVSPTFIFTSLDNYKRLQLQNSHLPICIVGTKDPTLEKDNVVFYSDVIGSGVIKSLPALAGDGLSTILFTSGSTGAPKGVTLTHQNTVYALQNISRYIGYTAEDAEVVTLPISHSFGLGHVYCNLMAGGRVHLERGLLKIGKVLGALDDIGATGFPGTPLGYGLLLDRYSEVFKQKAKNLKFIVVNSAALPPDRAKQILKLFPDVHLHVYYGLTEASRSTFLDLSTVNEERYKSVGKPIMPEVKIELRDERDQVVTAANDVGEVYIKGPSVTPGYWQDAKLTDEKVKNAWLRTGDLGFLDEQGYLFLAGRTNDVVNVGGYKVYPQEVEEVLTKSEFFKDCGVVGISMNDSDVVVAAVVNPSELDENLWNQYCAKNLEQYKVPKIFISVDKIPRLESGKLKRNELKELILQKMTEVKNVTS